MKMVMAVIKPFKLDDVRDAVTALGIEGMTVTEVTGFGRQKGQTELGGSGDISVAFLPKVKIEVAVRDEDAGKLVKAIQDTAFTGWIGDGKIFVYDLSQAVRIRTGEKDRDAL